MTGVLSIARLVLRTQATRGRVAALGLMAVLGALVSVAIGRSALDATRDAYTFVDGYGLGLLVPLAALVFAAPALGDPAEDKTLVYLWLRPVPRSVIAVAAWGASLVAAGVLGVLSLGALAAASRAGADLVVAALAAAALATMAYVGIFLCLGLMVRRALIWGLAYLLIWEGFVARSGTAVARLSVLVYARTILADVAGQPPPRLAASIPVAIITPLAVGAVGVALTAWWLRRTSVA